MQFDSIVQTRFSSFLVLQVFLRGGVEGWLRELLLATRRTLRGLLASAVESVSAASLAAHGSRTTATGLAPPPGAGYSVEELARGNVCQVAAMALYCQWTRDCEQVQFATAIWYRVDEETLQ